MTIFLLRPIYGEVASLSGRRGHFLSFINRDNLRLMTHENPRLKYGLARIFRKELTPPEARLWARIKGKPDGLTSASNTLSALTSLISIARVPS